jgi:hypothetical protein
MRSYWTRETCYQYNSEMRVAKENKIYTILCKHWIENKSNSFYANVIMYKREWTTSFMVQSIVAFKDDGALLVLEIWCAHNFLTFAFHVDSLSLKLFIFSVQMKSNKMQFIDISGVDGSSRVFCRGLIICCCCSKRERE